MRPASRAPIVTAGLTWHPDTGPIRYTSDSSVRPNASAVATTPAATLAPSNLKPNISVATPTAKNTKIAVPRNSAANFRITIFLPSYVNTGHSCLARPQIRRYFVLRPQELRGRGAHQPASGPRCDAVS